VTVASLASGGLLVGRYLWLSRRILASPATLTA
jgi:hypothetical protein